MNELVKSNVFPVSIIQDYYNKYDLIRDIELTTQSYEYAQRLRMVVSIDQIVNRLSATRSYYPIYHPSDVCKSDNTPCCVGIQFVLTASKRLQMCVIFRSNDMLNAWPLNMMGFRRIHEQVYNKALENIKLTLGEITTISINAHMYDLDAQPRDVLEYYNDPDGYYTFTKTDDKIIHVSYFNRNQELIKTYIGSDYERLIDEVTLTVRSPTHAAYIAKEVTKLFYNV